MGFFFSQDDFSPDIYFERTECLLTLDGSEDYKVKIEGLLNYKPIFIEQNKDDDDMDFEEMASEPADMPGSDIEFENDEQIDDEEMHMGSDNNNIGIIVM